MGPTGTGARPLLRILGGLLLLFILTGTDIFLDRRGWLPLPSSVVAIAIITMLVLVSLRDRVRNAVGRVDTWNGILWLLSPLLVISGLSLLGIWRTDSFGGEGSRHFFLMSYTMCVFAAALVLGAAPWLHDRWRGVARLAVFVSVISIVWDLVVPGSHVVRGAGLGYNANSAAAQTVLPLALALRYDRLRFVDLVTIGVGVFGVFATLSRGGYLMLGCVVGVYVFSTVLRPLFEGKSGSLRALFVAAAAMALVVLSLVLMVGKSPWFKTAEARHRIEILAGRSALIAPHESRVRLAEGYVRMISEKPLLGHGTGFIRSQPRGPHNMFLRMWVELGIIGLAAYVAWLAMLLHLSLLRGSTTGFTLFLLLVLASMVTHNLLEFRLAIMFTGIEMGRLLVPSSTGVGRRGFLTGEDHATP